MNHAGTSIQILPLGSKGHTGKFTAGIFSVENTARIKHGHMGTKGTRHPFNNAILFHQGPLGVQVHHIPRPVFNCGITQSGTLPHIQLYTASMKIGNIIFWCTAALNKMKAGIFFQNNQGMLKLTSPCRIQAEIGLQGNVHMNSLWHINKGAARPYSSMKSSKFMVFRRNQLHKMFLHQLLMLSQGSFHISIHHTLLGEIFLNAVIYHLRIILSTYTCQRSLLCLWNTQTVKGGFDILWYILPFASHLSIRLYIGNNFIHIQLRQIRPPGRQSHVVIYLQSLQAPFQHPLGIMLPDRYIPHYIFSKSFLGFIGRIILIANIIEGTLYIINKGFIFVFHNSYLNSLRLPQPAPDG